jgi:hypothetical protein
VPKRIATNDDEANVYFYKQAFTSLKIGLHFFPVDVLGGVLKKRVSHLRQHPRQEVDLVFLVDSSASVGSDNFYNACASDINSYLTPLGQARQFIETCGTYNLLCGK